MAEQNFFFRVRFSQIKNSINKNENAAKVIQLCSRMLIKNYMGVGESFARQEEEEGEIPHVS